MSKTLRILLVEDSKYFRLSLTSFLRGKGFLVDEAITEDEGRNLLKIHTYDLALVDMELENSDSGLNLLKITHELSLPTVIISSISDNERTEEAYNLGAQLFLSKLNYKDELEHFIKRNFTQKPDELKDIFSTQYLTQTPHLIEKIKGILNINIKNKTLFITGETGVGKTMLAKLLHSYSFDEKSPFIHLNCSEIPEELIEAELFGYKKGAFTGAIKDHKGKLEMAHGGILFLDEIATISLGMQQKLLRAIEEKCFYPLNSNQLIHSNFTLISATCENIFKKISTGEFREDFFYRISGINLNLPPLRERKDDVNLIIDHIIKNSPKRIIIKDEAREHLKDMEFKGNIRELKKIIERLSLLPKGIISKDDLLQVLGQQKKCQEQSQGFLTSTQKELIRREGLKKIINLIENEITHELLRENEGKVTQTIRALNISSSHFYRIFNNLQV